VACVPLGIARLEVHWLVRGDRAAARLKTSVAVEGLEANSIAGADREDGSQIA
jgi:hypothetical protein